MLAIFLLWLLVDIIFIHILSISIKLSLKFSSILTRDMEKSLLIICMVSCGFILILSMLFFFIKLVRPERYIWSSKLGLLTYFYYLNFILNSIFFFPCIISLNLDVTILLMLLIYFCKVAFLLILQWFNKPWNLYNNLYLGVGCIE